MSRHLKRLFAPKSWKITRKSNTFVSKPSPGPHKRELAIPLNVALRDMLGLATTAREVKYMTNNKNVLVDGFRRKDHRFPIGLFDALTLGDVDEHYRVVLDEKGKLDLIAVDKKEVATKLCKITGKKAVKGKTQLNLYDGKNILVDKDSYKVGDAILITTGEEKPAVKEHVKLEKGALIFLTGGKHIGHTGTVQDIAGNRIIYKIDSGEEVETLKKYAFPLGKSKSLITIKAK